MSIKLGLIVPGLPHPLLAPERNPSWQAIRNAYDSARQQLIDAGVERIPALLNPVVFDSRASNPGRPQPRMDSCGPRVSRAGRNAILILYRCGVCKPLCGRCTKTGASCSHGFPSRFPVDTGSIVANNLLNPDNRFKVGIVSCNMYADRAETVILGKAAADVLADDGVPTAVIAVTCLSERMHTEPVPDADDHLSSLMDDEWNRKLLELLDEGRLEDVSQLARTFAAQAHADNKLKAIWWLGAVMGQHTDTPVSWLTAQSLEPDPLW